MKKRATINLIKGNSKGMEVHLQKTKKYNEIMSRIDEKPPCCKKKANYFLLKSSVGAFLFAIIGSNFFDI